MTTRRHLLATAALVFLTPYVCAQCKQSRPKIGVTIAPFVLQRADEVIR